MMEEIRQKKLHKEAFYHLYSAPNIITLIKSEVMRLRGFVTSMGEIGYAQNILARKLESNEPSLRPKYRRKNDIKDYVGP